MNKWLLLIVLLTSSLINSSTLDYILVQSIPLTPASSNCFSIDASFDGSIMAVGCNNGKFFVYSRNSSDCFEQIYNQTTGSSKEADVSSDGSMILKSQLINPQNSVLFENRNNTLINVQNYTNSQNIYEGIVTDDKQWVFFASQGKIYYQKVSGGLQNEFDISGSQIQHIQASTNYQYLVAGTDNQEVLVLKFRNETLQIHQTISNTPSGLNKPSITKDFQYIVLAHFNSPHYQSRIYEYNSNTDQYDHFISFNFSFQIRYSSLSEDKNYLAILTYNNTKLIKEPFSVNFTEQLNEPKSLYHQFSENGEYFITTTVGNPNFINIYRKIGNPLPSCTSCDSDCKTCYKDGPNNCNDCIDGKYEVSLTFSNNVQCTPCDVSCYNCSGPSNADCYSCAVKYDFDENQTCINCTLFDPLLKCEQCQSANQCTKCDPQYYPRRDGSEINCSPCSDLFCVLCQNATYCTSCLPKYTLKNNRCLYICGNFLVDDEVQECDNGLGIDYDGCSDSCQTEENFTCNTKQNICSYNGIFSFQLISSERQMFSNFIKAQFKIQPPLYAFQKVDVSKFFSFNDSALQQPSFWLDPQTSILHANFTYEKDIENLPFQLIFNIQQSSSEHFSATKNHQENLKISSTSKFLALAYSNEQYALSQALYYIGFLITALSLLICLIGMFSPHKLAGLQIMFVIQYAFVALIWFPGYMYLPFYCLYGLKFSTGFNYLFEGPSRLSDPQLYTFDLNAEYFSSNFNFNLIFCLIPFIGILISKFILYKTPQTEKDLIDERQNRVDFFHQLLMYAVLFNLTYLIVCLFLFYSYGDIKDGISEGLVCLSLIATVATLAYFCFYSQNFHRFRLSFQPETLYFHHYVFHTLCIILGTIFLCVLPQYPWVPFIPQGLLLIYTIAVQPYKILSQNVRSCFNILIMCLITSMRVYSIEVSDLRNWNSYIYPLVVQICLFIIIVWAYVVVIMDFVKWWKDKKKKQNDLVFRMFKKKETINKIQQVALNSSAFRPPANQLLKFRIPNSQSPEERKKRKKEQKKKEKQREFGEEAVNLSPEQEQLLNKIKKKELPSEKKAVIIIDDELDFLRYQKAVKESLRFKNVDKRKVRLFDEI